MKSAIIIPILIILFLTIPSVSLAENRGVVVLANSGDSGLSHDFFVFLANRGFNVTRSKAEDFQRYKTRGLVVILGGPDALEGVGEIVREVLDEDEEASLKGPGSLGVYIKQDVWIQNQKVIVIAGADRGLTARAVWENMEMVSDELNIERKKGLVGLQEILTIEESKMGLDCGIRYHLTCSGIYNSFEIDKMEFLVRASEAEWLDYQTYVNTNKNDTKTISFERALWVKIQDLRDFGLQPPYNR